MKSRYKMMLTGTLGIVVGAFAMGALRAQPIAAPPPAYLIANIEDVTDPATMAQYGAAVPKTEAAFGGHSIVRGALPVMLDSTPQPKGRFVILQFPSMKALQDWWNSPAYAALRPLREKAATSRIFALEGIPPQ